MKKTKREKFLEFLKNKPILADGAMGTYLYQKGFGRCPSVELENIFNPDAVFEVHREYINAGAKIITTNTFGANRINYQRKKILVNLKDVNVKGLQIAKKAAKGLPVWVGASIGPLSVMLKPYGDFEEAEAREVCLEQIKYLCEEMPDLFIIESQKSVLEAIFFIDSIKKVAPDIPIIASLTINKEGRTFFGDDFLEGLLKLEREGADVLGLNCSIGPSEILYFVEKVLKNIKAPLSVMPNAGHPVEVDKRIIFLSEPNYFAQFSLKYIELGATIVGGCCGTNPDTIRKVKGKLEDFNKGKREESIVFSEIEIEKEKSEFYKIPQKEGFFKKLGKEFVITCEIEPPKGPDVKDIITIVNGLKNFGADAINIADNPMARARVSSLAVAHFIKSETGLSTILHLTCRDRNLLALQSDILGAALLGVSGILVLGGDPTALGDYPEATSVYDVNVVGLIKIISSLNNGLDFSDNKIEPPTNLSIGIALNLNEENYEKEIEKAKERIDAGAGFALTQPIFEEEIVYRFIEKLGKLNFFVLPGILPLKSLNQALYLKNEVPGIVIPDKIINSLQKYKDLESQRAKGLEIALNLLKKLKNNLPGAYLTTGGKNLSTLKDLLYNFSK